MFDEEFKASIRRGILELSKEIVVISVIEVIGRKGLMIIAIFGKEVCFSYEIISRGGLYILRITSAFFTQDNNTLDLVELDYLRENLEEVLNENIDDLLWFVTENSKDTSLAPISIYIEHWRSDEYSDRIIDIRLDNFWIEVEGVELTFDSWSGYVPIFPRILSEDKDFLGSIIFEINREYFKDRGPKLIGTDLVPF